MISERTQRILLASKVKGVGRRTLFELVRDRLFFELDLSDLHDNFPELAALKPSTKSNDDALRSTEQDINEASRRNHSILSFLDQKYPRLLTSVPDRPALLFVAGSPDLLSDKSVAIVGTREPTAHGLETCRRITSHFSANGWQIISGLAKGIDAAAHCAAVECSASTVAVLAHGLEKIYPSENREIAAAIVDHGGLLVSEYPYFAKTFAPMFVERDRIQAGMARAVIMIQSDEQGGSWHASRAALKYGRKLLVPNPTERDLKMGEPKIRGNMKIMNSSKDELARFLKCSSEDTDKVNVIYGREDYEVIAADLDVSPNNTVSVKLEGA